MPVALSRLLLAAAITVAGQPAFALDAAGVFEKTRHAIFLVVVTSNDSAVVEVVGEGSAVLIAPGRLVTNCHVVERGSTYFVARREDRISERARIVARFPQADLCELDVIKANPAFEAPVQVAPADALRVGDPVYAIGSPRGMELTISNGIVSALRDARGDIKVVQTTAPVSPGSSGGGLFDGEGRLVGITTMGIADSQNLNFAVAARHIKSAGIAANELASQRAALAAELGGSIEAGETAFERATRLRRQEEQSIEARKKQTETPVTTPARPVPTATAPAASRRTPKEMIAMLAVHDHPGDARPAKAYERLAKGGELTGLDDNAIVHRVYGDLIRDLVAVQMKWSEGGSHVTEIQLQLRRNGEIMFLLPGKSSGLDRFDREAQRAVGSASPFPVPQDNAAFEAVRNLTLAVRPPLPKPPPAKKK